METKESRFCRWFGHKWQPVYINKTDEWKFIATHCERRKCWFGQDELLDFLKRHEPIINSYSKKYFN